MGRLTIAEAENLLKSEVIDEDALEEMKTQGLVGTKRRGSRRFLKGKHPNGNGGGNVYPTLYFSGLGKGVKYTKDMIALKDGFSKLIQPYTTTSNEKGESK